MLALDNGMDAVSYKKPKNLTACFGYPTLVEQWDGCCEFPLPYWMLALVNGMDAVSDKQFRNVTA